ncbi:MAG: 4Fe-4S binding protein [Chloroflexota bacterium]
MRRMVMKTFGDRKKALIAFTLTILLLAFTAQLAFACDITIEPASTTARVGDQQQVVVRVVPTHKNCTTPIEDTIISGQGLAIVGEAPWVVAGEGHEKTLTVQFTEPGQAVLSVVRECPKGGGSAQITFDVQPSAAVAPSEPSQREPAAPAATVDPTAVPGDSSTAVAPPAEPTPAPDPTQSTTGRGRRGRGGGGSSVVTDPTATADPTATSPTPSPSATVTPSPTATTPPAVSAVPPTTGSTTGGGNSGKSADLGSLLTRAFTEPRTLAMTLLLGLAAVGYIKGYQRLRKAVLLFSLGYIGFYLGGCLCPVGAVQNLALAEVTASQKVFFFVTLGVPVVATLLFGRLYCGWVCPAGALQELVHLRRWERKVPPALDRWLKLGKYVTFVALIAAVRILGEPVFEGLDPFKAAFNLGGETVPLVGLALIVGVSVFVYRPWCRYLCPVAAVFAVASRFSLLRLVPAANCVACKLCVKACASQSLKVEGKGRCVTVDHMECLSCGSCQKACRKTALRLGLPGWLQRLVPVRGSDAKSEDRWARKPLT